MKKILLSVLLCIQIPLLFAQENVNQENDDKYTIHIKKTKTPIKLDGLLEEEAWKSSDIAKDFFLNRPYDSAFASLQTEVRILFDDNFIYVGAICYQPQVSMQ